MSDAAQRILEALRERTLPTANGTLGGLESQRGPKLSSRVTSDHYARPVIAVCGFTRATPTLANGHLLEGGVA